VAALAVIINAGIGGHGVSAGLDPYHVAVVQTTANLSERLTPLRSLEFASAKVGHIPVIHVNAGVRYQRVQGFGAAMTDTSAWLIEQELAPAARETLMGKLFGPGGIRLDFVKVAIGASDFTHTGQPYTYDDMPAGQSDPGLAQFSIAHDES
jgi:glucosylceramidase